MAAHGKARFVETLIKAQEKGNTVAVYADSEDFQSYEVGFVDYVDKNEVVLLCLTPKGEPDGRRALRTEDISRLDTDNAYTRKLELLYQYRDTVFERDFANGPDDGARDLRSQLERAREKGVMVHLVDSNDYGPSGFVTSVGDDYVEVQRIGSNGEPDGHSTVLMNGISKVHIGRRQEQVLEFLHRYNYGLKKLLEP
jgi:hypothetical protein